MSVSGDDVTRVTLSTVYCSLQKPTEVYGSHAASIFIIPTPESGESPDRMTILRLRPPQETRLPGDWHSCHQTLNRDFLSAGNRIPDLRILRNLQEFAEDLRKLAEIC